MLYFLVLLCLSSTLSLKISGDDLPGLGIQTGMIKLHPPKDVTAGYVGSQNIYIYWFEPENYQLHLPPFIFHESMVNNQSDTDGGGGGGNVGYNIVTEAPESMDRKTVGLEEYSWIGHELVPFHKALLLYYIFSWKKLGEESCQNITLSRNETEYHLSNLEPNTTYEIMVTAFYESVTHMDSPVLNITTQLPFNDSAMITKDGDKCHCDEYGTKVKECVMALSSFTRYVPRCTCKEGHTGLFCERCAPRYFRTHSKQPCLSCPCNSTVSSGLCQFIEDKLWCIRCNEEYAGKLCELCKAGYYRHASNQPCRKCQCRGRSEACDPSSGYCIGCSEHTTGYSCERCLEDYIGDPLNGKPCVHKDSIEAHSGKIIIGVCIMLTVLIAVVVGFILFKRWKNHPNRNKFWTVELRDDHERVNFSALPEDEIQARRMDYDFYQDQGGERARDGSQKYSQLQEI